jgi:DNA end-binding protein Ku
MAHALGSLTITFGLVSIPVRLYSATRSLAPSFHLVHAECGGRIRQQIYCPTCDRVVEQRADPRIRGVQRGIRDLYGGGTPNARVRGLPHGRHHDICALGERRPDYFEATYYLGPDARVAKPYRLLADAMAQTERAAVAVSVMRGKESPVLVRVARGGLVLHTLYFADEVRDFGEIAKGEDETIKPGELDLATRLVTEFAESAFRPEALEDTYRQRVADAAQAKATGASREVHTPPARGGQVIDLMSALKQSLGRKPPTRVARATAIREAPAGSSKRRAARKAGSAAA